LEEDAEEDTEETILFIALLIQSYFCFRCDASIVPGCQRTSEEGENRETVIFHFLWPCPIFGALYKLCLCFSVSMCEASAVVSAHRYCVSFNLAQRYPLLNSFNSLFLSLIYVSIATNFTITLQSADVVRQCWLTNCYEDKQRNH